MARLFCVQYNFSPDLGNFFPEITNDEKAKLNKRVDDPSKVGFESVALIPAPKSNDKDGAYYRLDEKMKTSMNRDKNKFNTYP